MYRYVLVALLLAQPRPEPLLRIEAPLELAALRVNLKVFQRRYKMKIAVFLPDIAIKLGVIDPLRKANRSERASYRQEKTGTLKTEECLGIGSLGPIVRLAPAIAGW